MRDFNVYVKDLTADKYVDLKLPIEQGLLEELLNKNHEYIICDSDLNLDEYHNVYELNKTLNDWMNTPYGNTIEKDDLRILLSSYLWNEVEQAVNNESFVIVNFDDETSSWNNGYGVVADEWWKGYLLHSLGYVRFPFEYTEDMEDYVRFENLWTEANCNGWREINWNSKTYLVHI